MLIYGVLVSKSCTPIFYKRDANRFFCSKKEFIEYFEKRVRKTISRWKMLEPDSKIAVAVSGGKDSMTLLHVLYKIEKDFPSELMIIHLDEGIKGYSDKNQEIVKKAAEELGIPLYIATYKELFGFSIDDIAKYPRAVRKFATCTFCGVWRRWALNFLALKVGADRLATAHCLDDEAQTIIMNVLRGSLINIYKLKPYPIVAEKIVPRIKPFRDIPEREVTFYAHLNNIPYNDVPCPYATEGMRWNIRIWLYQQEEERPGTLYNILRFGERLILALEKGKIMDLEKNTKKCQICGFPATGKLCKAHELQYFLKKVRLSEDAL